MQEIENFEKAFYQDGFKLGMNAVNAGADKAALFSAIQEMYTAIDGLNDSLSVLARQQGQSIECKVGCEWCCHQPVFALDYELDYLKDYIDNYFDDETKTEIKQKAERKQNKLGGLKDDALLNAKSPCPLLNDGACFAYEARPIACRIYLSSSVKSCMHFYNVPDDKKSYPALLDLPMRLGRMMNEGFKSALKMSGIVPEEFRIEEKLTV
ncbi:YkgJ family cysteine cluster protein [uncultured Draconibacterium sp.]|uniref:YkgJ family cysteine cluster protein n=1 Tax=uncultured Draconibacterium sp. TaxID=1573823 RepID=UPI00321630D3